MALCNIKAGEACLKHEVGTRDQNAETDQIPVGLLRGRETPPQVAHNYEKHRTDRDNLEGGEGEGPVKKSPVMFTWE